MPRGRGLDEDLWKARDPRRDWSGKRGQRETRLEPENEYPEKGTVGSPVTGPIESVAVAATVSVSVSDPVRDPGSGVRDPGSGCFIATK